MTHSDAQPADAGTLAERPEARQPRPLVALLEADCTCVPGEGCDEEGQPGCAYCRSLDPEWPCPAELVPCPDHDDTEGPHHNEQCCYYAEDFDG